MHGKLNAESNRSQLMMIMVCALNASFELQNQLYIEVIDETEWN